MNDTARATRKHAHHAQESLCRKSKAECLRMKAKHRAQEAGEEIRDKVSELKGKID